MEACKLLPNLFGKMLTNILLQIITNKKKDADIMIEYCCSQKYTIIN